ncbi:MAG: transglycosylase SLT domain-containing protein [Prevotellaceae bacterium]|nr:transglycosylase SLT domain-containing protein [Prevotellaceae bacterium]MDY6130301.1 transglycosylase SLT domain-containing protein [Prevotella sp.]
MKKFGLFILLFSLLVLIGCSGKKEDRRIVTPWGEVQTDSLPSTANFTYSDIVTNGELIMLTLSGPETYYDYHGKQMGAQFLLCEKFSQSIGVSLRVEVCKDTMEMVDRLIKGEADLIAFPMPMDVKGAKQLKFCGLVVDSLKTGWAVAQSSTDLARILDQWYQPDMLANIKKEEAYLLSSRSVKRHVYSPFLNRSSGVISKYDHLFKKYAPMARWDWRLMAAQCYQESCFDPNARSWAGARGLMQIMPRTAAHLGLPMDRIHEPEPNIAASAKYLQELSVHFKDIQNTTERQYFVLASYNGGAAHVRDAMALTRKNGGNPQLWGDVSRHLLLLSNPLHYQDPVVKSGYMRSSETYHYVERIRERYAQYRGVPVGKLSPGNGFSPVIPRKAKRKNKYRV